MSEGRWVLLIASEVGRTDSVSDRAMERLVDAIASEGYEVVRTSTPEDGLSLVTSDPSYSAILLDWDLEGDNQFDERAALQILRAVRRRNKKMPIFLIADRTLVSELPLEVVKQVHEYIHLFGDTPAFIANRVDFAVERYHERSSRPTSACSRSTPTRAPTAGTRPATWAASPSSNTPSAWSSTSSSAKTSCAPTSASPPRRSAAGSTTSALRANPSATPPASSARTGPSTSSAAPATSNQIVGHGVIAQDDIVLADANCHKSICHSFSPSPARAPSTSSPRATATA